MKVFFGKRIDMHTEYRIIEYMTMIRKAILKRMDELKMNPNQLSKILKGSIPRMTIYDFLSGKSDARSEVVGEIMKALGLKILPKSDKKGR